ncbi:MAG: phosphotransferase [Bacteroidales bacterium]|nr:phosphotransferase [Bacteroidales bacterium]MBQ7818875.1 phosphotransferase [Bacteroidales bacterium]
MNILSELYYKAIGVQPKSVVKLSGDGSNRTYYRLLSDKGSLIGVSGVSTDENNAFITIANVFNECGIDAPKVIEISSDGMHYLIEDLGDETLFTLLKESRECGVFNDKDCEMLCQTMALLADIQFKVGEKLNFDICYPVANFDRVSVFWDLNYFKYCFLKGVGIEIDEPALESDFETLCNFLLEENDNTFLYRDFQSRNVMWHNNKPYFIDFQGGRRGPIYYDVASFVGQTRAKYSNEVCEKMINAYICSLRKYKEVNIDDFYKKLNIFRIFRLLQTLGTYGYRGLFERKKAFIDPIPATLNQIDELLNGYKDVLPYISKVMAEVKVLPRFKKSDYKGLTVDVMSFSYHRGIPDDYSGNGGGFVFDCRAIHNPGRYEQYKKLNGTDAPVIEFLEQESNICEFLDSAYSMVDNMVDTYMKRGFTHIQICCGCTGGQHRSVYSAEHIAKHIADKFGVRINVKHIMLNRSYTIPER